MNFYCWFGHPSWVILQRLRRRTRLRWEAFWIGGNLRLSCKCFGFVCSLEAESDQIYSYSLDVGLRIGGKPKGEGMDHVGQLKAYICTARQGFATRRISWGPWKDSQVLKTPDVKLPLPDVKQKTSCWYRPQHLLTSIHRSTIAFHAARRLARIFGSHQADIVLQIRFHMDFVFRGSFKPVSVGGPAQSTSRSLEHMFKFDIWSWNDKPPADDLELWILRVLFCCARLPVGILYSATILQSIRMQGCLLWIDCLLEIQYSSCAGWQ